MSKARMVSYDKVIRLFDIYIATNEDEKERFKKMDNLPAMWSRDADVCTIKRIKKSFIGRFGPESDGKPSFEDIVIAYFDDRFKKK